MTNLVESPTWASVQQLETSDLALAGPGQVMNAQAQALANRTKYLYDRKRLERATPEDYLADPTGTVDCTALIAQALLDHGEVHGTPGAIYLVKDLVIDSRAFRLNGAVLRAAPGSKFGVKLTGYKPALSGGIFQDGDNYIKATTLSVGAAVNQTALTVANSAGIEAGMVAMVDVDGGGSYHVTEVSSVVGSVVNIRDGLPTGGASSGRKVVFSYAAVWVENALWWEVDDIQVTNARGALLIKPTGSNVSNYGTLRKFTVPNCKYFGGVKQGNAGGVKSQDVKIWGGWVETVNAVGNGTAGPFTFITDGTGFLKRDLTLTVNGVAKVYPTHWTFASDTSIQFTSGNFPATGAAIVMSHFRDGIRGWLEDHRGGSILTGGNDYKQLEVLDFFIGVECQSVQLTDFDVIADTCSYASMQLTGCQATLNINKAFLGFSRASLKVFNSLGVFGRITTARVPTRDTITGTVDDNIFVDATAVIELNTPEWTGGDYQINGPGTVNLKGCNRTQFFSTPGAPITAGGTDLVRYLSSWGDFSSVPAQAPMMGAAGHFLEAVARVTSAPGASKTYTIQMQVNGVDSGAPFTITGSGVFEARQRMTTSHNNADSVDFKVTAQAGSAPAEFRILLMSK